MNLMSVCPETKWVEGSNYADIGFQIDPRTNRMILMAAIDTTQRPAIYINGKQLPPENNGLYEFVCGSTGIFDFQGYLEVPRGDGSMTRHEFSSSYTVVEPSATISATLMNVLYAGIGNPISISVPGIPNPLR